MSVAKRLVTSTAIVTVSNGAARLMAFVVAPVLTAVLGPGPYGTMALIYTGSSILATVALAGIDMSYARCYFEGDRCDAAEVERLCWRFAVFSSLVVGALFALGAMLAGDVNVAVIGSGGLAALGVVKVMAETRLRVRGSYRRIAAGLLAGGVIGSVLAVALSYWRQDAWPLCLAAMVALVANVLIAGTPRPATLLARANLAPARRRAILVLGLPGVVSALMYWAIASSDRWLLAYFADGEAVGVYAFACSIATVGLMLNSAITLTWFPEAASAFERDPATAATLLGRLWERIVAGLIVVWLAVAALGGDVLKIIASDAFHAGAEFIPWIAAGTLFFGVASLANTGLLLAKDLKPTAAWWTTGAAASVVLNLVAIPRYGALGAAVVNCLCHAGIAVGVMAASQRRFLLCISWSRLLVVATMAVTSGLALATQSFGGAIASLVGKLVAVAVVSAVAFAIIAPDWAARVARSRPSFGGWS